MHKLHIVHQDIKPENIMYSLSYNRPVFIDFGLSRIIDEEIGLKTCPIMLTKINCYMNKTSSSLNKSMKRIIILHIFVYLWLSIMCLINNLFTFTSYTFKKGQKWSIKHVFLEELLKIQAKVNRILKIIFTINKN